MRWGACEVCVARLRPAGQGCWVLGDAARVGVGGRRAEGGLAAVGSVCGATRVRWAAGGQGRRALLLRLLMQCTTRFCAAGGVVHAGGQASKQGKLP